MFIILYLLITTYINRSKNTIDLMALKFEYGFFATFCSGRSGRLIMIKQILVSDIWFDFNQFTYFLYWIKQAELIGQSIPI